MPTLEKVEGVTFVVPVYNKARHLPTVLTAIKGQSGDFPREYVFVDDGSTDDSRAILEAETRGWPGVTIVTQPNSGSASATNTGLKHARMPFVKFVDADDLLTTDATELLLAALSENPVAVLAYGDRRFFRPGEVPDLSARNERPSMLRLETPIIPAMRNSMFNPTQFLARSEACRRAGGCDERIVFSQEYTLTMRLARLGPFVHVDAPLAFLLDEDTNRLSNNPGRQLQRVTRALGYFVKDNPDLEWRIKRFACRRASGRSWRYARRELYARCLSRWHLLYLRGLLGIYNDAPQFIEACAEVYDSAPPFERGVHLDAHP